MKNINEQIYSQLWSQIRPKLDNGFLYHFNSPLYKQIFWYLHIPLNNKLKNNI
jgi:hypothetical protein